MRIALLSDIHGNIDALRSVLDDAKQQKVNNYAILGDLIFLGLYPRECYEEVMNLSPIALIKGIPMQILKRFHPMSLQIHMSSISLIFPHSPIHN